MSEALSRAVSAQFSAQFSDTPIAFVDLETTGSAPAEDRITEVGIVEVARGRVSRWSTLVDPQRPIPFFIQQLTGITDDMVRAAPTFAGIAPALLARLDGRLFVAHNANFDRGFLRAEFRRLGLAFNPDVLCTVRLSRALFPAHKRHGLDALVERHALAPLVALGRHRALADADLLWQFWQKLPTLVAPDALGARIEQTTHHYRSAGGIPEDALDAAPAGHGVYAFHGGGGGGYGGYGGRNDDDARGGHGGRDDGDVLGGHGGRDDGDALGGRDGRNDDDALGGHGGRDDDDVFSGHDGRNDDDARGGHGGRDDDDALGGRDGRNDSDARGGRNDDDARGGHGGRNDDDARGGHGGRDDSDARGGHDGRNDDDALGGHGRRDDDALSGHGRRDDDDALGGHDGCDGGRGGHGRDGARSERSGHGRHDDEREEPAGRADHADRLPDARRDATLYVGRSTHVRQRVRAYLWGERRSARELRLARQTTRVTWQATGGELGALLLQARWIGQLRPALNRLPKASKHDPASAPWPFEGAVLFDETDATTGARVFHVIDQWCYVGHASSDAQAAQLAQDGALRARPFELTTYRIFHAHLARGLRVRLARDGV